MYAKIGVNTVNFESTQAKEKIQTLQLNKHLSIPNYKRSINYTNTKSCRFNFYRYVNESEYDFPHNIIQNVNADIADIPVLQRIY